MAGTGVQHDVGGVQPAHPDQTHSIPAVETDEVSTERCWAECASFTFSTYFL